MFNLEALSWLILVFVGIFLIGLFYTLFNTTAKKPGQNKIHETGKRGSKGICPVCGSFLKGKTSLISALYPGEKDRLCYIYGCPHCYPTCKSNLCRECPVCKNSIGQEQHLVARYYERLNDSKRVHILGCSNCRLS